MAARKAVRAGRLSARLSEYRYQVLTKTRRTGHVTDTEGDADPAPSHDA